MARCGFGEPKRAVVCPVWQCLPQAHSLLRSVPIGIGFMLRSMAWGWVARILSTGLDPPGQSGLGIRAFFPRRRWGAQFPVVDRRQCRNYRAGALEVVRTRSFRLEDRSPFQQSPRTGRMEPADGGRNLDLARFTRRFVSRVRFARLMLILGAEHEHIQTRLVFVCQRCGGSSFVPRFSRRLQCPGSFPGWRQFIPGR